MGQINVVQRLSYMFGSDGRHSFQLNDNLVFYKEIGNIITYKVAFVFHLQALLSLKSNTHLFKLNAKCFLIDFLC